MKQKEIQEMSLTELNDRLTEEKAHLAKLRLNHSVSPIENPLTIRTSRRTIARIQTELNKRAKTESSN